MSSGFIFYALLSFLKPQRYSRYLICHPKPRICHNPDPSDTMPEKSALTSNIMLLNTKPLMQKSQKTQH